MKQIAEDEWVGCYRRAWGSIMVPAAMVHPAKMSVCLVERIYRHIADDFGLPTRARVLDPFGGVCGTAWGAVNYGYEWLGVELEQRFVALGRANLERWKSRLFAAAATLLQGDSRNLRAVLAGADAAACVSSPPFMDSLSDKPSTSILSGSGGRMGVSCKGAGYSAVVSSPPYEASPVAPGPSAQEQARMKREGPNGRDMVRDRVRGYSVDAVVSSPPYEGTAESGKRHGANGIVGRDTAAGKALHDFRYSDKRGGPNLGGKKREEFWTAARTILDELREVLPTGAPAVWVVKNFCRKHQIVTFEEDWERLCNSVGFVAVHRHRALLGNRKSFFRRMYENKGGSRINHETVLCTVRTDG